MRKVFCPNCGHPIDPHAEFCGNCGYNLKTYFGHKAERSGVAQQPMNQRPVRRIRPRKHHGWIWLIVIIIIVAGGYFGYRYWNHQSFTPVGNHKISFKVSTYPDSKIYLNGRQAGTANDKGVYKTGKVNAKESVMARYNDTDSKTVNVNSDDDNTTVSVNYYDLISHDTVQNFMSGMFSDVGDLANNDDDSDNNEDLSDYYEHGDSNSSYHALKSWAKDQYHSDSVDNINFDEKIDSIEPIPNHMSKVTYDVKYDFDLDNGKERIQVFRWRSNLKKVDGHWYIVKSTPNNTPISDHTESGDDD